MPKRKGPKAVPRFSSEAEERAYWAEHDLVDHADWSAAKVAVFPNLKPSTETISLRLPLGLLAELKRLANKRDVPYQSLLKVFLAERVAREQAREGDLPPRHRELPPARSVAAGKVRETAAGKRRAPRP